MAGLDRTLLSDQAYHLLRERLLTQQLEPGSRLVESVIAKELQVSQAPIRDALRRLAHEGFVLQLPRRGSFVAHMSTEEAHQAYKVRAALERVAVEHYLQRRTETSLDLLDKHLQTMIQAAAGDDLGKLIECDAQFHRTIWEESGVALLVKIWPMVEVSMRDLTQISNRLYFADLDQVARTHEPLLAALRAGDPQAVDLFHDHVLAVWTHVAEPAEHPVRARAAKRAPRSTNSSQGRRQRQPQPASAAAAASRAASAGTSS